MWRRNNVKIQMNHDSNWKATTNKVAALLICTTVSLNIAPRHLVMMEVSVNEGNRTKAYITKKTRLEALRLTFWMAIMMLESDTLLGPQHHEFRQRCHKCIRVRGRWSGEGKWWWWGVLIVKAANTGVHLDESDSTHEAVRALHATKREKLVSTTHIHTQRRDDGRCWCSLKLEVKVVYLSGWPAVCFSVCLCVAEHQQGY